MTSFSIFIFISKVHFKKTAPKEYAIFDMNSGCEIRQHEIDETIHTYS